MIRWTIGKTLKASVLVRDVEETISKKKSLFFLLRGIFHNMSHGWSFCKKHLRCSHLSSSQIGKKLFIPRKYYIKHIISLVEVWYWYHIPFKVYKSAPELFGHPIN